MQLRRYIAFLFRFVYLSATAGSSWTALTCTCAARHACSKAFALQSVASHDDASPSAAGDASSRTRHASRHGGAVCSCRLAAAEVEGPLLAAPCCRHLHLNLELLLARCCDGERCRQHLAYHLLSDELPVASSSTRSIRGSRRPCTCCGTMAPTDPCLRPERHRLPPAAFVLRPLRSDLPQAAAPKTETRAPNPGH